MNYFDPKFTFCLILLNILIVGQSIADESVKDPWYGFDINGFHTFRYDHYDGSGPRASSTLPFEGDKVYGEFGLNFYKQDREYARWRGQIFGVVNDNEYRSPDDGIVPETLALTREVGDTEIPYRYQLGDYFTYFSNMTQQRSLKGAQLELQPQFFDQTNSMIFFIGANESNWRDLTPKDDFSLGASYLFSHPLSGTWSLNSVFNYRDSVSNQGLGDRDQLVSSISWFNEAPLAEHNITFESEFAYFRGDHNGTSDGSSGDNKDGTGFFAELTGISNTLPMDYRFRAERYSDDFQPRGGVITPDRRSLEAHSGWDFDSGVRLKARAQAFDDAFQSSNKLETRTLGLNFNGPIFGNDYAFVNGVIDTYFQSREDENDTIDQELYNLSADINMPLPREWYGLVSIFTQFVDDKTPANADLDTYQVSFSGNHDFEVAGFKGIITPGLLVRMLRDSSPNSDDIQPTLAFNLNRDAHYIGFNYGYLSQDRSSGVADIVTQNLGFDYKYEKDQNTFGAELIVNKREPDPGADNDDWSLGIYWTRNFERIAPEDSAIKSTGATTAPLNIQTVDVYNLSPGLPYTDTAIRLAELGLRDAYRIGDIQVWEARLLPTILQRQRLAIDVKDDKIVYSGLIIDFENVGSNETAKQLFDDVQRVLFDTYGPPTSFYEKGEFIGPISAAINSEELIRIFQWETTSGIVRFGIPRRLDGRVRMEVQHRESFPPPRETLWSIEQVR